MVNGAPGLDSLEKKELIRLERFEARSSSLFRMPNGSRGGNQMTPQYQQATVNRTPQADPQRRPRIDQSLQLTSRACHLCDASANRLSAAIRSWQRCPARLICPAVM
jgi:hypothetical protein